MPALAAATSAVLSIALVFTQWWVIWGMVRGLREIADMRYRSLLHLHEILRTEIDWDKQDKSVRKARERALSHK